MPDLGRISGPLLAANLTRNNEDLAFETDLLYFNLTGGNRFIGINNSTPTRSFDVTGTTYIPGDLLADNGANLANVEFFDTDKIGNSVDPITFYPARTDPLVTMPALGINDVVFRNNTITNPVPDGYIGFGATGSGTVNLNSDAFVDGDLHATGTITWDGNMTIGDSGTDTISFGARVSSNILPKTTLTYDLGLETATWANLYIDDVNSNSTVLPLAGLATTDIMYAGNVKFQTNEITSTVPTTGVVYVAANGTGKILFNGRDHVNGNDFNNTTNNVISFPQNTTGYVKFGGSTGLVLPIGTTAERVAMETGALRYNTTLQHGEVYSGTEWIEVQGVPVQTAEEITGIISNWTLILA